MGNRGPQPGGVSFEQLVGQITIEEAIAETLCTCEYPYPAGVWEGHHPHCGMEPEEEDAA
jgi:hypothetical protein